MKNGPPSDSQRLNIEGEFNLATLNAEDDIKRKKLIMSLETTLNGRVITYFANFQHPLGIIHGEDIMLFEEILKVVNNTENLYLIINSPGGYPDVAEKMIMLCRARCKNFYVIVPNQAKSAATMIALGSDKIFMSDVSELGPIDPILSAGQSNFQAWAYLSGFEEIKNEILRTKNPLLVQLYLPILSKIDPTILDFCKRTVYDSRLFAEKWLKKHMMKTNMRQAKRTAKMLSEAEEYLTHTKIIDYQEAKARLKLTVEYIDKSSDLWKQIWELYVRSQNYIMKTQLSKLFGSSTLEIRQAAAQTVLPQ